MGMFGGVSLNGMYAGEYSYFNTSLVAILIRLFSFYLINVRSDALADQINNTDRSQNKAYV